MREIKATTGKPALSKTVDNAMQCDSCGNQTIRHVFNAVMVIDAQQYRRVGNHFVDSGHRRLELGQTEGGGPVLIYRPNKKSRNISLLMPDTLFQFGDIYAYWVDKHSNRDTSFCSWHCASAYASNNNCLLLRKTDGAMVSPRQAEFDEYARAKNLTHHLALVNDSWNSSEEELRALLQARLPSPDRQLALAASVAMEGKHTVAERALEKILQGYPLDRVIDKCAMIYGMIGKPEKCDELFEADAQKRGGWQNLYPERLSTWALLSTNDGEKALRLSSEALKQAPSNYKIVENHIGISQSLEFLRQHAHMVQTSVGCFNAGQIYLRANEASAAEEYFRLADYQNPEPDTKAFLAECLYRLGRYAEALHQASHCRLMLETAQQDGFDDADGKRRLRYGYSYRSRRYTRKLITAVEGKALIRIGETTAGRERIKDALDIDLGFASEDILFSGLRDYTAEYESSNDLRRELDSVRGILAETSRTATLARAQVANLANILDAVGLVQRDWKDAFNRIKEEALTDAVSENFSAQVHAFSIAIRNLKGEKYATIREKIRFRFRNLPERMIEQLANSHFLQETIEAEEIPAYAGAIIEKCKAIESGVNEIIVAPFVKNWILRRHSTYCVDCTSPGGRSSHVEVAYWGVPKHLMIGDLIFLLRSSDAAWVDYIGTILPGYQRWLSSELPAALKTIKNDYRNGCAHYSSADRHRFDALTGFLEQNKVIEIIDAVAACAFAVPVGGPVQ